MRYMNKIKELKSLIYDEIEKIEFHNFSIEQSRKKISEIQKELNEERKKNEPKTTSKKLER